MDKKKNAPDNDDLDQFLKEMDDIDKRENSLRMHLNIVSKKMRDSINLDELLKDIEEVRQDMFENQHLLISSPIYETSREYDLSRQTTPANPSQLIEDQASVTNLKPDFQVPEDPEEFLREIEMMNERRKKVHLRMEEVLAMNDKLNEEKARREVKKSAEEKGKGKGDPQEIVQGKLQVFQEMKEHVYDCLPIRHKFRVKALIDFDPRKTYTEEEATSMMFFRKSTSIIVISCFTADWLVGYADLDAKSYSVMKILPSTVIIPHYEALPTPKRTYEILDWESFGSAAEQVDPGAVESLRLSVINKSMHLVRYGDFIADL
eukprot:TRINITY_DN3871_c0_g3_i1.p1 TRINITY_DN3871_c0_g3~~TRINITY_DN3871_c0_g3_i1.p1  ORF type:complete len:319 (+),score=69.86 TRINITY_DN3871_c0_g3_i1:121-1077(+)